MEIIDLIKKKRDGQVLTDAEISYIVDGYTNDLFPDYQMSSLLMAIYFKGMNEKETANLAQAMLDSGEKIDFSMIKEKKVDKHSTGGVGDKISIALAPLVASAGLYNPMISGRGLGHTGGTLDKLEAIPGFDVNLSEQGFIDQVETVRTAIVSASGELAPADRKIYALRDTTGTVESIPLIASSIMSKKLASGIDALVLDVKTGKGAFMQDFDDARNLARELIAIGTNSNCQTVALITNMNQPLGKYVGNSLEIIEAIEILKGAGPKDTTDLTLDLGAQMLVLGEIAPDTDSARKLLAENIKNGQGLAKFGEMITAQHGNPEVLNDYSLLPIAKNKVVVKSPTNGFVASFDTNDLGMFVVKLGGGRLKKTDKIDFGVGLELHKKVDDPVNVDEPLMTIYYEDGDQEDLVNTVLSLVHFSEVAPDQENLIYEVME